MDSILKLVNTFFQPNKITKQTYEKIKNASLSESLGTDIVNKAINDYIFWFYNINFKSSSIRGYSSSKLPFLASEEKRKNDLINFIESTQGRNHLRGAIDRHQHTVKRVAEVKVVAENLVEMINNELNN